MLLEIMSDYTMGIAIAVVIIGILFFSWLYM
ncbi:hypothetical protein [Shigella phage ESh22]|nr:hypothetical protein [Shigella phage ESh21]URY12833.1 hypothetical protein [Shigella phage ESh22]